MSNNFKTTFHHFLFLLNLMRFYAYQSYLHDGIRSISDLDPVVHTLLDTDKSDWDTWTDNTETFQGKGWLKRPLPQNRKGYGVCEVKNRLSNEQRWLFSPYIPRGESENIVININFTMRSCSSNLKSGDCLDNLRIFIHESNNSRLQPQLHEYQSNRYISEALIAERPWSDPNKVRENPEFYVNIHQKRVHISSTGFFLLLRDTGSCILIERIQVLYLTCPPVHDNFAVFQRSLAGQGIVRGDCLPGSAMRPGYGNSQPQRYCGLDGKWRDPAVSRGQSTLRMSNCQCLPGYTAVNQNEGVNSECRICSHREYKQGFGTGPCLRCPENSRSSKDIDPNAYKFDSVNMNFEEIRALLNQQSALGPVSCECLSNFYRHPTLDKPNDPCTTLPSPPQHINVDVKDLARIHVSWSVPMSFGGRMEPLIYRVNVEQMDSNGHYFPAQVYIESFKVNQTNITINGMEAGVKHRINVVALNDLSDRPDVNLELSTGQTEVFLPASLSFRVEDLTLKKMVKARMRQSNDTHLGELQVNWKMPLRQNSKDLLEYEVDVLERVESQDVSYKLQFVHFERNTSLTINKLPYNKNFFLRVRARNHLGWGNFSYSKLVRFSENDHLYEEGFELRSGNFGNQQILAVVFALILVLAIFICACLYFVIQRKRLRPLSKLFVKQNKKEINPNQIMSEKSSMSHVTPLLQTSPNRSLPSSTMIGFSSPYFSSFPSNFGSAPSQKASSSSSNPVIEEENPDNRPVYSEPNEDEHNIENNLYSPADSTCEVLNPRESSNSVLSDKVLASSINSNVYGPELISSWVKIESVIGCGEFGKVCRGILQRPSDDSSKLVAIKTLKPQATEKERENFLAEASIMAQLHHPNIIKLEGVVIKDPVMIITEYMSNQSLDRYLKAHKAEISLLSILEILKSTASAMSYLAQRGFVHRDLAARNILLDDKLQCKVSDFGLSREVDFEDQDTASYTTMGGKIPVRWTAPESIALRKFTTASDVWSFGVLMWEVISFGERPFWNWSNQAVLEAVESGYRLPPPENCPIVIYKLMNICWASNRFDRPNFEFLMSELGNLIKNPVKLSELATSRPCENLSFNNNRRIDNNGLWLDSGPPSSTISRKSSLYSGQKNSLSVKNDLILQQQLQLQMQQMLSGTLPNLTHRMINNGLNPVSSFLNGILLPNGSMNTAANTPIEQWLHWFAMDQYAINFIRFGVPTLAIAQQARLEDLVQMGISRVSDRQMIWHHLQASKQNLDPRVYTRAAGSTIPSVVPQSIRGQKSDTYLL